MITITLVAGILSGFGLGMLVTMFLARRMLALIEQMTFLMEHGAIASERMQEEMDNVMDAINQPHVCAAHNNFNHEVN